MNKIKNWIKNNKVNFGMYCAAAAASTFAIVAAYMLCKTVSECDDIDPIVIDRNSDDWKDILTTAISQKTLDSDTRFLTVRELEVEHFVDGYILDKLLDKFLDKELPAHEYSEFSMEACALLRNCNLSNREAIEKAIDTLCLDVAGD